MIEILNYTHKPLHFMGACAGACWGANTTNYSSNCKRGLECLEIPHGRVLEYADVTMKISGYSARAFRELRTHGVGTTTLQSSTRYIDYKDMEYVTPHSIENNDDAIFLYKNMMKEVTHTYSLLNDKNIPREDIANILPLGMNSVIILKINVRALIHLADMRLCNRTYHEMRKMVLEMISELSKLDEEWKVITEHMNPKCYSIGYCTESKCCGLNPRAKDVVIVDKQKLEELKERANYYDSKLEKNE